MRSAPLDLDVSELERTVFLGWGITAVSSHYVPEGGGSHHWTFIDVHGVTHFVTVDDLDDKTWIGDDRDVVFHGVVQALRTSVALRQEAGLEFVLAPVLTADGATSVRVSDRYAVSVFPFLEGVSHRFGRYQDAALRTRALALVASLHSASSAAEHIAPHHVLGFNGQTEIAELLDGPSTRWDRGPFGETARRSLLAHAEGLSELVARFDALAERTAASRAATVVTHGEPHAANLMKVNDELVLIDWDTVGLAPPERDLWMVVHDKSDIAHYERLTGRRVDVDVLTLYDLRWFLDDLGSAARMFRAPHVVNADTERWVAAIDPLLGEIQEWRARFGRD